MAARAGSAVFWLVALFCSIALVAGVGQVELQELAERLNGEFNAEQLRINEEARDSIQAFLKIYNEEKKYDYVMIKAGDNLLIANPEYDITAEIVEGLNKRYKGKPAESNGLKKMGE